MTTDKLTEKYIETKARRMASTGADELDAVARWASDLAAQVRRSPKSGWTASGLGNQLDKAGDHLAKAEALFALLED